MPDLIRAEESLSGTTLSDDERAILANGGLLPSFDVAELVARLRDEHQRWVNVPDHQPTLDDLPEAAALLEQQQAEIARLNAPVLKTEWQRLEAECEAMRGFLQEIREHPFLIAILEHGPSRIIERIDAAIAKHD